MKKSLAVVCGVLFAGSIAFAQQLSFEELDADGDGSINKEEAATHAKLSEAFDAVDIDQDGGLSQEEFAAVNPE